jgi:O-antigen ligase
MTAQPALALRGSGLHGAALLGLVAAVALVLTIGPAWRVPGLKWYDGQRLEQILLLLVFALLVVRWPALLSPSARLGSRLVSSMLVALAVLGLVSVVLAPDSQVALVDYGLWLGCGALAWALASLRARAGATFDGLMLLLLLVPVLFYALGFWFRYLGFVLVGTAPDAMNLLEGFQNRRFMSQWQTPLLAAGAGLVLWAWPRSRWGALALATILAQWWCINMWTGSRSTMLGMLVAGLLSLLVYPGRWRWLQVQTALLAAGFALYWLSVHKILGWLGLATPPLWEGRMSLAGLSNGSGRDLLWQEAWRQGVASPWFGSGPAHFVDSLTADFAHPHNLVLQFLAEWGVVAALLVLALLLIWVRHGWRSLRCAPGPLALGLDGAVAASVAHAMTDGIHVMPLGQLAVAVFMGWLFGVVAPPASQSVQVGAPQPAWLARPLALLVVAAMLTALSQVPALRKQQALVASIDGQTTRLTQLLPRTWQSSVVLQPSELALPRRRREMP